MLFQSTRQIAQADAATVDFTQALLKGLAPDGGLFVPQQWPLHQPAQLCARIGLPPEDNFPYPLVHAMAREIDIFTVFRYANVYPSAIALVAEGRVDTKSLITHRFPLEKAEDALLLSDSRADGVIKAMVEVA